MTLKRLVNINFTDYKLKKIVFNLKAAAIQFVYTRYIHMTTKKCHNRENTHTLFVTIQFNGVFENYKNRLRE